MWQKPCWVYRADTAASQLNHCGQIVLKDLWPLKDLFFLLHCWTTTKPAAKKKKERLFILLWNYWHYKYCNIGCLTLCFFMTQSNKKGQHAVLLSLRNGLAVYNWAWRQVEKDFKLTVENCAGTPPVFGLKTKEQRCTSKMCNFREGKKTKKLKRTSVKVDGTFKHWAKNSAMNNLVRVHSWKVTFTLLIGPGCLFAVFGTVFHPRSSCNIFLFKSIELSDCVPRALKQCRFVNESAVSVRTDWFWGEKRTRSLFDVHAWSLYHGWWWWWRNTTLREFEPRKTQI